MEPMDASPQTRWLPAPDKTADPQTGWDRSETAARRDGAAGRVARCGEPPNHPERSDADSDCHHPLYHRSFLLPESPFMSFLAALTFSVAAFTDYLDGFLARARGR